jgi:hypothetical protein
VYTVSFKSPYATLAASTALTGTILSALSYMVLRSTPLTALGISAVLIAAVSFTIARGQPKISPEASAILLQSGAENISAIVEELGLKSKAIYLPTSISGDKPKALIPLDSKVEFSSKILPKRLIVKYGSKPSEVGLLISTPGSAVCGLVKAKSDWLAEDLESAISSIRIGTVNLADGVRVIADADKIMVEVCNPRLENSKMWIYESLGTPIGSIVASIVAQVVQKPVSITIESFSKGKCVIELKVVGRGL